MNRPQKMVFRFLEEFEDEILEAYSYGNGRFTRGTPDADDHVCFTAHKAGMSLEIVIEDLRLIEWLHDTIPLTYRVKNEEVHVIISMELLLPCYPSLIKKITHDRETKQSFEALELFVRGFLEEGSVFSIFGFEYLYESNILTEQHFRNIQCQHRCMTEDLEDLDHLIDQIDEPEIADVEKESLFPDLLIPELREAIKMRDLGAVASILAKDHRAVTAKMLCLAIRFYELPVFRLLLLHHGAQVEGNDVLAEPLYRAAKAGHMDAVRMLLSHGANIEGGKFCISPTPLTGASSGGYLHIAKYLIENGANVDGNRYKVPLSRAIKNGHSEIVKYLLACGANLAAAVPRYQPWKEAPAIAHNLKETLSSYISGMNRRDREDLFSTAITKGDAEYVKILCESGCNIDSGPREPPIYLAAECGHIDIVRFLVSRGADLNLLAARGLRWTHGCRSPLAIALYMRHLDVADYLSTAGATLLPEEWQIASRRLDFLECHYLFPEWNIRETFTPQTLGSLLADIFVSHIMRPNRVGTETSNLEHCPAIAAIQAQERQRTGRNLLAKVSKSCRKLLDAGGEHTASAEFVSFTKQIGTSSSSWKKGTRAIRNIVEGYLPSHISDIICSLQVADAMQSVVPSSDSICSEQELRSLRNRLLSRPPSSGVQDRGARLHQWHPIDQGEIQETFGKDEAEPPDPGDSIRVIERITVLMAGAIFGAVLLFLCCARFNFAVSFPYDSSAGTWHDWASNRILVRNCFILATYLASFSLEETGCLINDDDPTYEVDESMVNGQSYHPIFNDLEHLAAEWLSEESDQQIAAYASIIASDNLTNDALTNGSSKSSTYVTTPLPAAATSSSVSLDTPNPVAVSPQQTATVHCPRCQKPFSLGKNGRRGQTSNLGKHMRLYHPEDVPNHTRVVYRCKHGCPYKDPVKSNVKAHENRHCSKRKGTKPRKNGKYCQDT
ncbi:hypothetical protein FSARC_7846 [Fusarium sarcochroum]|uniref:Ankyrin repeat protein n=1 Tax=Fusarium sarcochroum TaxID=1208366 RepID=A0A8H4TUF0_9HYPO|nr:hypothetical protein FSARC_7846 [Fusarium sarcochroum]